MRSHLESALALVMLLAAHPAKAATPGPQPVRMVPQLGHTQFVRDIHYAASGRLIVTAAKDDKVKIWSPDGRLLRTIHIGMHNRVALSPDGTTIAVSRLNSGPRLWSVDGELLAKLPRLDAMIADQVAFSPQGDAVWVCSKMSKDDYCQQYGLDGSLGLRIPNPTNGKERGTIAGLGFSANGGTLFLAAGQTVYRYDSAGELAGEFAVTEGYLASMAVSPDGGLVAVGDSQTSRRGSIPHTRLWTTDGSLVAEFPNHACRSLGFSRDGEWLVAGGWENNVVLRVHRSGREHHEFRVGTDRDTSPGTIGVSPDGNRIVVADKNIDPVTIRRFDPDGKPLGGFRQKNNVIMAMDFDPNSGTIVTASLDNTIRYWSTDGALLRSHPSEQEYPNLLAISPNGRAVVAGGTEITVWDGAGRSLAKATIHRKGSRAIAFTPDGRFLLTGGIDGYVTVIGLAKDAKSTRFVAHDGDDVLAIAVHPDGKRFASGTTRERFRIWDLEGNRLGEFTPSAGMESPFSSLNSIAFTPDGEELVVNTRRRGEEVRFYGLDGEPRRSFGLPSARINHQGAMALSGDGRRIAVAVNHDIGVWSLDTLERKQGLRGHRNSIRRLEFTPNGDHLVSADTDGVVRVWNVDSGRGYAMLSGGDEWIVYSDDGYFDASRYGGDLVTMVSGHQAYGIDQFAVTYNRPDLLLERAGLSSDATIRHFRGFHERRLDRLGTGTLQTRAIPTITVEKHVRSGKFVELDLETFVPGESSGFLQIHVNDVPVFRGIGEQVPRGRHSSMRRVELSAGRNKIEVGVIGPSGVESLRVPLYEEFAEAVRGDLYFVGLGVAKYRDSSLDLEFADDDARDMGTFLEGYGEHFGRVRRLELTDDDATREALPRIESFLSEAGVDDTVILLVSGHGAYDFGDSPGYYFLSHEADPENLTGTAIAYDRIEGLLSGIAPRRRLVFLDTCQSGEFDAETLATLTEVARDKGLSVRARRRLVADALESSKPYVFRRDRYIYNDVSRRTGAVVFSSSLANEVSVESTALENGVFTHSILETLSNPATDRDGDGFVSFEELEASVKRTVTDATGGLQHPEVERENIYQEILLPVRRPER